MSKNRRRTQPSQKPLQTRTTRWPQMAALIGVVLLAAAILILKNQSTDPGTCCCEVPLKRTYLASAVSK